MKDRGYASSGPTEVGPGPAPGAVPQARRSGKVGRTGYIARRAAESGLHTHVVGPGRTVCLQDPPCDGKLGA